MLPNKLQGELNLSGRSLCRGEKARALNALPLLIEDRKVVGWRGKIRAVEDVEKLRAELGVEIFRDPPHVVILENRKVQLRQPWPNHDVAPQIAAQIRAIDLTGRGCWAVGEISAGIRKRCRCRGRHARESKAVGIDINGPRRVLLEIWVD